LLKRRCIFSKPQLPYKVWPLSLHPSSLSLLSPRLTFHSPPGLYFLPYYTQHHHHNHEYTLPSNRYTHLPLSGAGQATGYHSWASGLLCVSLSVWDATPRASSLRIRITTLMDRRRPTTAAAAAAPAEPAGPPSLQTCFPYASMGRECVNPLVRRGLRPSSARFRSASAHFP
jgi:hypothetical protein